MKHKKLITTIVAITTFLIVLGIFLIAWFFGDKYKDFEDNFRKEFSIPGLSNGAVPQGIGTCEASYSVIEDGKEVTKTQQYFFTSNYMADGSPSRIYVTGSTTGYVGYVTLKNIDGSNFYGHCGGLATNGTCLWVTGEDTVYVAKASSTYNTARKNIAQEIVEKAARIPLENTADGEEYDYSIKFTASFKANCNASFCYYFDDPRYSSVSYDRFYVGEFYRKGNYETASDHRMTTPTGYKNTAVMYEYYVSSASEFGLTTLTDDGLDYKNKVPEIKKIYSIPEKIQGIAFSGRQNNGTSTGTLMLSESYGLANSHILCFDWRSANLNYKSYSSLHGSNFVYDGVYKTVGGSQIPYTASLNVYYIDKNDPQIFVKDYSIPSMSEGMCSVGNRVYILFESAGKKYKTFVRERLSNVYSIIPHL